MLSKKQNTAQFGFYSTFEEQLSHQHPLYILANTINWNIFEEAFSKLYSDEGRPAKPIRLMVSLIILKHIRNISDESVVEQWFENIYYQYFSGEKSYACGAPCEASELVHFRNRIGTQGIELIFKESIRVNGKDGRQREATTDTTCLLYTSDAADEEDSVDLGGRRIIKKKKKKKKKQKHKITQKKQKHYKK